MASFESEICECEALFRRKLGKQNNEDLEEYFDYLREHDSSHQCHNAYDYPVLVASCRTCEMQCSIKTIRSCICIPCLLKSDHEGHDLEIQLSMSATCDCGNPLYWKADSACSDHKWVEGRTYKLSIPDDEIAALKAAIEASVTESCCPFYTFSKMVSIGDSVASMIAETLMAQMNVKMVFHAFGSTLCTNETAHTIMNFFGSLINNNNFRIYAGIGYIDNYIPMIINQLFNEVDRIPPTSERYQSLIILNQNWFHFITPSVLQHHEMFNDDGEMLLEWISDYYNMQELLLDKTFEFMRFTNACSTFLPALENIFKAIITYENTKKLIPRCLEILFNFMERLEYCGLFSKMLSGYDDDPKKINLILTHILRNVYIVLNLIDSYDLLGDYPLQRYKEFCLNSDPIQKINKYEYVLDGNLHITNSLPLHYAIGIYMMKNVKNIKEIMKKFAEDISVDFDELCRHIALPVVYLLSAIPYTFMKMFAGTSFSSISSIASIISTCCVTISFPPYFSLVQILLGITDDKDSFIQMLASVFGVDDINDENHDKCQLVFMFCLCCFLFNKQVLQRDYTEMRRITYSNYIKINKQAKWNELQNIWIQSEYDSDMLTFLKKETTATQTVYKLKTEEHVTPFAPWMALISITKLVAAAGYIFNLPPTPLIHVEGLDFEPILRSPALHDILLVALCSQCSTAKQFAMRLIEQIPGKLAPDFAERISQCGEVGSKFFEHIHYNFENEEKNEGEKANEEQKCDTQNQKGSSCCQHSKSQHIQAQILKNFAMQNASFANMYDLSDSDDEQGCCCDGKSNPSSEQATCCVCNSTDKNSMLYYPICVYKTSIPSELEDKYCDGDGKTFPKPVKMIHACQHLIHKECIDDGDFQCPIDRSHKNALMPRLVPCKHATEDKKVEEVHIFLDRMYGTPLYLTSLLHTLCGYVIILEVRFRSNKMCFYRQYHCILVQNLVEIIRYVLAEEEKLLSSMEDLSPFEQAALRYIQKKEYMDLMPNKSIIQKLTFLRRMIILKTLMDPKLIACRNDNYWDCIDVKRIASEYKIDLPSDSFELPKYTFNFPHYYHDIFREKELENAYDFLETTVKIIQTGDVLRMKSKMVISTLADYLRSKMLDTPFLVFFVSGQSATSMFMFLTFDDDRFTYIQLKPIYLDQQGEEDVGIDRPALLTLSEENCNENIDMFLSGEWTFKISEPYF